MSTFKPATVRERPVEIDTPGAALHGDLAVPDSAAGVVVFAHGSGSSRHSPRNRAVAEVLRESGFGTLLMDLLTEKEEQRDLRTREYRFDIELLGRRLVSAVDWLNAQPTTSRLGAGLFGASTGAAAALTAAAERPSLVGAVVSRGGRPDLAGRAVLGRVSAPTLLIVGSLDVPVIVLNRRAMADMSSTNHLEIVAGATHLFEEPGTLDQVARLASSWFARYLK